MPSHQAYAGPFEGPPGPIAAAAALPSQQVSNGEAATELIGVPVQLSVMYHANEYVDGGTKVAAYAGGGGDGHRSGHTEATVMSG